MSCGLPGRDGFKAVTLSMISVNSWKTEISPATKSLSIVLRFSVLSSSSLLCSAEDCRGRDCHPTGHTLFWTCKVHWSFHQANRTHSMTLWLYIQSYTSWLIIDMPACHHCNLCLDSYCQILAAYQNKNGFRLCFDFPHFTCQKIQSILLPRNGLTWSFFI